ncbi:3D-(3,5/4)-trihydroxycyclohexane-1,2-dione acylhydrolase (decyclizing) [Microbacterium sp. 179-I 3D3 NHS]|uniref:3D-(3,5/4)-trihydroxycyclohexane-1,2-dione acylhydrolase (decyclizing) n=1 Tax=Microbacterium sp. 179-I 3D3 NHS TaxID=3142382 RepID=UPI00399F70CD
MNRRDTVRLTTSQAVVRWLQAQYSERDGETRRAIPGIWGIFGHGNVLGIDQAIQQDGGQLPLFQPKNEQAMVHAAMGYAKASRRLATYACSASIGPGALNMITGAGTATTNRLPVLLLPSDTFANRRQGNVLQELEHPVDADLTVNDAFRPISRFFDRIARPEQLLTALPRAMRVLLDPAETGAVTLSLHQDVQGEAYDYPVEFFRDRTWHVARPPAETAQLHRAAELLRRAERPLIVAGGGVRYSEAEEILQRFAGRLGIPVVETSAGKGALPGDFAFAVGGIGVNGTRVAAELARDADVVLAVGTRLTDFTTGSHSIFQHPEVQFIGLNVNAADAHKVGATPVVADARDALTALDDLVASVRGAAAPEPLRERVDAWERELADHIVSAPGDPVTQGEVWAELNATVGAGDWVVAAAGWQPGDMLKQWKTPAGSFTHIEFGFSCMGHEIPAGLGIRLHEGPDGEVIVVIGDGTYLMSPTEIVTAVQERQKLTILVLDNSGYQSISRLQLGNTGYTTGNERRYRGASGLLPDGDVVPVDFAANAASMGAVGVRAHTRVELAEELARARERAETTVIVVPVADDRPLPDSGVFWDLGVPLEATDAGTADRVARFAERRSEQQRYY